MPDEVEIGGIVAANVLALRKAAGLSLDQLAKKSGVSKGMVVQIGQAKSNASIATLVKLANALGVSVARLVEPSSLPIARKGRVSDAPLVWQGSAGGTGKLLAGLENPSLTELWEWRLLPSEAHDSLAHMKDSKEILLVQAGQLIVSTSLWQETVNAHESLVFSSDVPHRYFNPGPMEAVFKYGHARTFPLTRAAPTQCITILTARPCIGRDSSGSSITHPTSFERIDRAAPAIASYHCPAP